MSPGSGNPGIPRALETAAASRGGRTLPSQRKVTTDAEPCRPAALSHACCHHVSQNLSLISQYIFLPFSAIISWYRYDPNIIVHLQCIHFSVLFDFMNILTCEITCGFPHLSDCPPQAHLRPTRGSKTTGCEVRIISRTPDRLQHGSDSTNPPPWTDNQQCIFHI